MGFTSYIMPIAAALILAIGLFKKVDIFSEFISGAKENLKCGVEICPALITLVLTIGIFRQSGALDILTALLYPVCSKIGYPTQCIALALIRPISGSGATAVFEDILSSMGAESYASRIAAVMMGSSETTFYTIAVYFSVTKVKKIRHTLLCSLLGDFVCFIASFVLVNMLYSINF